MSGRIVVREGVIGDASADAILSVPPLLHGADCEESLRDSFRAGLEDARGRGCRSVAAPALGAGRGGLPLQRAAEILIEEARRHLAGETCIEEIRFVLDGEPSYRVFEAVQDAARVAEQMERLRQRP
jgi:O-acetyl-ADP-ribose deacetylase (regulator of RNase III)